MIKILNTTKTEFYDSHVHLDILLQMLKILPKSQKEISFKSLNLNISEIKKIESKINFLLQNHGFVLHSTVSYQNFDLVYKLFKNIKKVKFLFGTHPELVKENFDVKDYLNQQNIFVKEILKPLLEKQKTEQGLVWDKRILGIGECGLDYFYTQDLELKKSQKLLFEKQIELSLELNLPLIIHCREAFDDLLEILKSYKNIKQNFLIHCFTGDKQILKKILDLGGKVAFGGILTFGQNADYLRESLNYCPQDSWLLETDLPFLTPNPKRGEICLPEYINFVAKKIAEIKNLETEQVWQIGHQNFNNLFYKDNFKAKI
jgi:TatD family hydrolase